MKTFEDFLDKMGYSWNDFDHTHEMEGLIEQYANERVKQSEQFICGAERLHGESRCIKQCKICLDEYGER